MTLFEKIWRRARTEPLVTPLAHDALSARLIARAGFRAFTRGGSGMVAARRAYPDIGRGRGDAGRAHHHPFVPEVRVERE